MINELFKAVQNVALHKQAKMTSFHKALNVCKLLKKELDYEQVNQLELYEFIITKRFQGYKLSDILADVAHEHPEIIQISTEINQTSFDDLEDSIKLLLRYEQEKKLEQIYQKLKKALNEFEIEEFPSVSEKVNFLNRSVSKAFEELALLHEQRDETELILDPELDIEEQIEEEFEHLCISTSFESLDEKLAKIQSSRVFIWAGGTGKGKSIWLLNLCYGLAISYKTSDFASLFENQYSKYKPMIMFISNENSISETRLRLASIITNEPTNNDRLKDRSFQADIFKQFTKETGVVLYLKYVPPRSTTAFDIFSLATHLERIRGYKPIAIIIDYLDRLKSLHVSVDKEERIRLGSITDELKAIAINLNVPIITATQLNREGFKSDTPDLTNISESWKKVENADAVIIFQAEQKTDGSWIYRVSIPKLRYANPFYDVLEFSREPNILRLQEHSYNNLITSNSFSLLPSNDIAPFETF